MPSILQLVKTFSSNYPNIKFAPGERFSWSPSNSTIYYVDSNNNTGNDATSSEESSPALLVHELGHALLGHASYQRDVELVGMEAAAWEEARKIAKSHGIDISDDDVQDHLDTYREWLHSRSTCPNCTANGFQTGKLTYSCPACTHNWRVNEARLCALRRYSL